METSTIPEIKNLPFFCDLPDGACSYLQSRLKEFFFPPNQLIIEEGKHGNFLGVVGHGLVDLEKSDGQIQTLLPGEMFGEQMLLFKQPCGYTVRSRTDSSLWVVTRSDWLNALQISGMADRPKANIKKKKLFWPFVFLLFVVCSVLFLTPELPSWANQFIVRSLLGAGQTDFAEQYLQIGSKYNPSSASLREAIGCLYYWQGDQANAQESLSEAVKLDESSSSAWNNLGAVTLIGGDPANALPALLKAVELDPGSPEVFFNLGRAYFEIGDFEKAVESLRRAAELKPDYVDARIHLAAALMQLRKFPEALLVWEEILYWFPEQATARFGKGVIAVLENRPEDSIPDLEAALLADPVDPYAHLYLGLALQSLQHPDEARIELETVKILSRDPEMLKLVDYYLNTIIENSK